MNKILCKTLPPHLLNFKELSTLLADVEAVLNSQPLLPLNTTPPNSYFALTSDHFRGSSPQGSPTLYNNSALLKCWDLVCRLSHDNWKQWSTFYFQTLQSGRLPLPTSQLETLSYLNMRSYFTVFGLSLVLSPPIQVLMDWSGLSMSCVEERLTTVPSPC